MTITDTPIDNLHGGRYSFLSNFYPTSVWYDGEEYPTVEHAYQASKTLNVEDRARILNAASPGIAKRLGRRASLRLSWHGMKIDVMRDLLRQKFQWSALREALLATGDRQIIEGNYWGDRFWGVCNGEGENNLGKLLMQVREEIRSEIHSAR